ncbi:MAG: hypothetical protein P4L46_06580 [Fimbriimonas sp.]|nr:hypothetical protein [Fimbriimonas sp.]
MIQSTDWLTRGGTYVVLGVVLVVSATFFYFIGYRVGVRSQHPNDGCLYGICNIILAFLGGGVGFLLLIHNYPYFILSSSLGAVLVPALGTLFAVAKSQPRR